MLPGSGIYPAAEGASARKDERVNVTVLDHRKSEVAIVGGCCDGLPHSLMLAFPLHHGVDRGQNKTDLVN
jgi:hypothetical protein